MSYLLDTHAYLWWLHDPGRLSPAARDAIEEPGNAVLVSVVSMVELAIKASIGKLQHRISPRQLFIDRPAAEGFEVLPLTAEHAVVMAELPLLHRDPMDRMLIAQALANGLVLITRDREIRRYTVATLW